MKAPRSVSGRDLANHLIRHWDYTEERQAGSHIILRTNVPSGQTLPVPAHKPLKTGTISALLKMVAEHKHVGKYEVLLGL